MQTALLIAFAIFAGCGGMFSGGAWGFQVAAGDPHANRWGLLSAGCIVVSILSAIFS